MMMSGVAPAARVRTPTDGQAELLVNDRFRQLRRIARVFRASTNDRRNPLIRARIHDQFRLQTLAQAHAPTPTGDVVAVVIRDVEVAQTMAIALHSGPVEQVARPLALHEMIPMKAPRILRQPVRSVIARVTSQRACRANSAPWSNRRAAPFAITVTTVTDTANRTIIPQL